MKASPCKWEKYCCLPAFLGPKLVAFCRFISKTDFAISLSILLPLDFKPWVHTEEKHKDEKLVHFRSSWDCKSLYQRKDHNVATLNPKTNKEDVTISSLSGQQAHAEVHTSSRGVRCRVGQWWALNYMGRSKKGDLELFERESLVDAGHGSFQNQVLLFLLFLFQLPIRRIANGNGGDHRLQARKCYFLNTDSLSWVSFKKAIYLVYVVSISTTYEKFMYHHQAPRRPQWAPCSCK